VKDKGYTSNIGIKPECQHYDVQPMHSCNN